MSTPETPRAYAVDKKAMSPWIFKAAHETPFAGEHLVKVYEAAPVDAERERLLDLLESQGDFLDTVTQWTGSDPDELHEHREAIDAVLREYGRLGKEES